MKPTTKYIKSAPKDWYTPGKSIAEFHADHSRIRVLIGSRGSGKTFSVLLEAVKHCLHTAGAVVRIFRRFSVSNEDSVAASLEEVLSKMGPHFVDTGRSLCKKMERGTRVRIPSLKATEMWMAWRKANPAASVSEIDTWLQTVGNKYCGHIVLDGLPDDDKAEAKIRSSQVSMLIFVEADQIKEDHVKLAEGCLRLRDADGNFFDDYSIILETNPPGTKHWLANWELGDEAWRAGNKEKGIPPRKNCKFWHIPIYENEHNMRPGYAEALEEQYKYDTAGFKRYVLGEYADSFDGIPVYKQFSEKHVCSELAFPENAVLVRGWDYGGGNNACVWISYFVDEDGFERFWVHRELWLQHSNIDEQARQVLEITKAEFPENVTIYDFGDRSGGQKTATGAVDNVLATYGIFPGSGWMKIDESIALVGRLLAATDSNDNPLFLINKAKCPKLYTALAGEYRYPKVGEPGWTADVLQPLKGPACNNADHIADALRYAVANMFRLVKVDGAETPKNFKSSKLNPKKIPR